MRRTGWAQRACTVSVCELGARGSAGINADIHVAFDLLPSVSLTATIQSAGRRAGSKFGADIPPIQMTRNTAAAAKLAAPARPIHKRPSDH